VPKTSKPKARMPDKKRAPSRTEKPENVGNVGEEKSRKWRATDALIQDAIGRLIQKNKKFPTQAEIAAECNIAEDTVQRHYAQSDLKDVLAPFRARTPRIMTAVAEKLEKEPDGALFKTWLKAVEGWDDRMTIDLNLDDPTNDVNFE
jgi:hypothetical protein